MLDNKDFYYDLAKFEVEMTASRGNFLLVFQSMLLGAIAGIADKQTFIPLWLLLIFGLITLIVWLWLNALTYVISETAFNTLVEVDERIKKIMLSRKSNWFLRNGSTSFIMSFVFSILTTLVWSVLLFYYCW